MVYFKKCPRCGGDLIFEEGWYYSELVCLQCGFHGPVSDELMNRKAAH